MLHMRCKAGTEAASARWSTVKKKGLQRSSKILLNHLKAVLPREGHELPQNARPTIAAGGPALYI